MSWMEMEGGKKRESGIEKKKKIREKVTEEGEIWKWIPKSEKPRLLRESLETEEKKEQK